MTDDEIRRYMSTAEFERRCWALDRRIDAGLMPTDADIAEALALPHNFIAREMKIRESRLFMPPAAHHCASIITIRRIGGGRRARAGAGPALGARRGVKFTRSLLGNNLGRKRLDQPMVTFASILKIPGARGSQTSPALPCLRSRHYASSTEPHAEIQSMRPGIDHSQPGANHQRCRYPQLRPSPMFT